MGPAIELLSRAAPSRVHPSYSGRPAKWSPDMAGKAARLMTNDCLYTDDAKVLGVSRRTCFAA
jgi:hypothetical protein